MAPDHGRRPTYTPLFQLAKGGMGEVELVARQQEHFVRLFAMKRLRPELLEDEASRAMFVEEGRVAGLLRHPNVVSVLDVGSDARGPYLVMDFVESVSAATLLTGATEVLPLALALRIVIDVARGLHAAHELTGADGKPLLLVHRDVSPPNILVGFDGTARIADFGIARALGRTQSTTTGWLKGKVRYMAPEQLRFEELDRRADLFALGVVLFELLSGQRLYPESEANEAARRILTDPPPDIAEYRGDVSPELVELLFELLAKSRDARPETAREVARRLEAILISEVGADVRLDEYLDQRFARERDALRSRIADAISLARSSERRRHKRTYVSLGLAGVLATTLITTTWAFTRSSRVAEASAVTLPDPSTGAGASVAGASVAGVALPSGEPAPEMARAEEAASVASTTAPSSSPVVERSSHAAKPKPSRLAAPRPSARSPKGSAEGRGVPLWETYE